MTNSDDTATPLPMSVQDEHQRLWRKRSQEAVSLAMQSRWEAAAAVNRELLAVAPLDVDAWNRLGKALLEVGDCPGAQEAFEHSLSISSNNGIARKNLERLARLKSAPLMHVQGRKVASSFFIEESSKTAKVTLQLAPELAASAFVSAGEQVELKPQADGLGVHHVRGQCLGLLPPALGSRLLRLMGQGNRYQGAVFSVEPSQVTLLLREDYQHPSQRSVHSFPGAQRPADLREVMPYRLEGTQGSDTLGRWAEADGLDTGGDGAGPAPAGPSPQKRPAPAG